MNFLGATQLFTLKWLILCCINFCLNESYKNFSWSNNNKTNLNKQKILQETLSMSMFLKNQSFYTFD